MAEVKVENYDAPSGLNSLQTLALGAGVIGIIGLALGAFLGGGGVEPVLRGYLLGFCFWCGISVGCTGLLVLQHLTGGSWGVVIRRVLEASAKNLWIVALLFIPIGLGVKEMYEWAAHPSGDKILAWKAPYLNVFFWSWRVVIYFAVWIAIASLLTYWSKKQDETADWNFSRTMGRFSGPALIAFVLAVSFAAIDWVMSLDPHWFSTMYGLLFVIGWALSAMAFTIALMAWLAGREPMNHILSAAHFHDLGKLMLAMVMVWAYFNFSQFLIIYSGNLPEETTYYLTRMKGGWGVVGVILILFHFAFPFLLLLSQDLKKRSTVLASIAVFVLLMRLVDLYYLIAPNPKVHGGHAASIIEFNSIMWSLVAVIAVGGIWLFSFLRFFKQRPIVPFNDPYFENAVAHGKEHH